MKVILAGGTGFLGRALWRALSEHGHQVVVLSRGPAQPSAPGRTSTWTPDGSTGRAAWMGEVDGADAVINLSGQDIGARRWTAERKTILRQSRILSTRSLVAAIRAAARRPAAFVTISGANYYGATGDEAIDESFPPGSEFLATLCTDWEAEARAAEALGCRVVILRSGIVLAGDGGVLKKLALPFRFLVGGPIASGRQYVSWIHRDDWIRLVEWTLGRPDVAGAVNATAPEPVTNEEFSRALGRALRRPSWLRVPRLPLRLLVGEVTDAALVNGQRVVPRRALDAGFTFEHPEIREALTAALRRRG